MQMHLFHQNFSAPGPRLKLLVRAIMPSSTPLSHQGRAGGSSKIQTSRSQISVPAQIVGLNARQKHTPCITRTKACMLVMLCDSPMHLATPTFAREPKRVPHERDYIPLISASQLHDTSEALMRTDPTNLWQIKLSGANSTLLGGLVNFISLAEDCLSC